MSVGSTILDQLGGRKFVAMTGSHSFATAGNDLSFKIPGRTKNGISACHIILDPSDTYTVKFFGKKPPYGVVYEASDIYCDMLQDIFTEQTGLDTHL